MLGLLQRKEEVVVERMYLPRLCEFTPLGSKLEFGCVRIQFGEMVYLYHIGNISSETCLFLFFAYNFVF